MESRPQAPAQVQNTRRTLGVDCRYQPVSDRSVSTATCATSMSALWPDRSSGPKVVLPVPSHRRHRAAVHADVGAVDETGTRAGEEGDEVRQFLHAPDAAQRIRSHLGGELALPLRKIAVPRPRLGDIAD